MAAQVGDLVDVRDPDRARVLAIPARRTGPYGLRIDPAADERLARREARLGRAVAAPGVRVEEVVRVGVESVPQVDRESLRRERLARQVRRADLAAAPALRARVEVELLLPAEVLDLPDAEALGLGGLLDVERRHLPRRVELREVEVRERRDDVEVLRERQVVAEDEDRDEMPPPGAEVDALEGRRRERKYLLRKEERHRLPDRARGSGGARRGALAHLFQQREARRPRREVADHQEPDEQQDEVGVEARVEALLLEDVPPPEREDDAGERRDEDDVLQEEVALPEPGREERQGRPREEAFEDEAQGPHREDEEAAEDERVVEARVRVPEHLPLEEPVRQDAPDPRPRPVQPVVGRAGAQREELDPAGHRVREKGKGGKQHEREEDRARHPEEAGLGGRDDHRARGYIVPLW